MDRLIRLVNQFRNGIEAARDAGDLKDDYSFRKFPRGCCGDTCELLAQYLLDHEIATDYTWGTYKGQTHAWLVTDNHIIIDITGDQFKEKPEFFYYNQSVYVGVETDFYKLFKGAEENHHKNVGLDALSRMCQPRLKKLYHVILSYVR